MSSIRSLLWGSQHLDAYSNVGLTIVVKVCCFTFWVHPWIFKIWSQHWHGYGKTTITGTVCVKYVEKWVYLVLKIIYSPLKSWKESVFHIFYTYCTCNCSFSVPVSMLASNFSLVFNPICRRPYLTLLNVNNWWQNMFYAFGCSIRLIREVSVLFI
jgi:hypothetical protein